MEAAVVGSLPILSRESITELGIYLTKRMRILCARRCWASADGLPSLRHAAAFALPGTTIALGPVCPVSRQHDRYHGLVSLLRS